MNIINCLLRVLREGLLHLFVMLSFSSFYIPYVVDVWGEFCFDNVVTNEISDIVYRNTLLFLFLVSGFVISRQGKRWRFAISKGVCFDRDDSVYSPLVHEEMYTVAIMFKLVLYIMYIILTSGLLTTITAYNFTGIRWHYGVSCGPWVANIGEEIIYRACSAIIYIAMCLLVWNLIGLFPSLQRSIFGLLSKAQYSVTRFVSRAILKSLDN